MKDRVLTANEVASICGVSADTVLGWLDAVPLADARLDVAGVPHVQLDRLRQFMMEKGLSVERLDQAATCILVVDDDPYYVDVIPLILKHNHVFTVLTAATGADAGLMTVEHHPHLVILDIHLPDLDGREVCKRIRSRGDTKHTRILGISGYLSDDEVDCLPTYGFNDFIKKPFQIETLQDKVSQLLNSPAPPVMSQRTRSSSRPQI